MQMTENNIIWTTVVYMNYTEIKDKLFIVMDIVLVVCFYRYFYLIWYQRFHAETRAREHTLPYRLFLFGQ